MSITGNDITILKVLLAVVVLLYASVINWRTLLAPNRFWLTLGAAGLVTTAYEFGLYGISLEYLVWFVAQLIIVYIVVYMLWRADLFGGGIAKSLIAIAILFPTYPVFKVTNWNFPVENGALFPIFSLTVLGYAIVFIIVLSLCILIYNLLTVPLNEIISNPLISLTSYKVSVDKFDSKRLELKYYYIEVDGKMVRRSLFTELLPSDFLLSKISEWFPGDKMGNKVWVTPIVPFVIAITISVFIAIFYGDVFMQLISFLRG